MIPKIIHQIWVTGTDRPAQYVAWAERLRSLNPDWDYMLHTPEPIEGVSARVVSNVTRLEIIRVMGGVYLDCDMESFLPLDALGMDMSGRSVYCDSFFGRPHHAFLCAQSNNSVISSIADSFYQLARAHDPAGYVQVMHSHAMQLEMLDGVVSPFVQTTGDVVLYHHMRGMQ